MFGKFFDKKIFPIHFRCFNFEVMIIYNIWIIIYFLFDLIDVLGFVLFCFCYRHFIQFKSRRKIEQYFLLRANINTSSPEPGKYHLISSCLQVISRQWHLLDEFSFKIFHSFSFDSISFWTNKKVKKFSGKYFDLDYWL